MIFLMSQTRAEQKRIKPGLVHCISPYLNPAHVMSPPRHWLEALVRGEYGWHFFRLRYKNFLRNRFREEPERFFALLDASQGNKPLLLTCHCLTHPCHREIAREYLEILRSQQPYERWAASRPAALFSAPALAPAPPLALRN